MKKHRGMKISAKLIITFLIIALIAGGLGAYGVVSLSRVNTDSNTTFSNYGNAQGYLGNIFGHFQMQRALLRDMTLERSVSASAEIKKALDASDAVMMQNLDLFEATCLTDEEKAAYAVLSESIAAFRGVRDELAQSCIDGDFDSAYEWIKADSAAKASVSTENAGTADAVSEATTGGDWEETDSTAAATVNTDGVDAVASATVSSNAKTAVENAMTASIARAKVLLDEQSDRVVVTEAIMVALSVVAVLLALVLGFVISRSISRPLGEAAKQLGRIAEGEDIDEIDTKRFSGELNLVARSINAVRASLHLMLEDSNMLTQAAVEGRLDARADLSRHRGGYRDVIQGVNNTLDAAIAPVQEASTVLEEMAKGNLNVVMEGDYQGDHAAIKDALNDTIGALNGYISEISAVLGEIAQGNLDVGITAEYRGAFVALKESINHIAESLSEVLGEINMAADQVAAGTRQVADGSQEISHGAAEQSSAIEQLTATVSEIAGQTRKNAMGAGKANELTRSAAADADRGNASMKAMQQAMDEINEASKNISKIIKVIDDIAFQTNILALNAAVEAARAGVHGKGFAVVAEEVRNLAARSAGAARETTELIEGSIHKTAAGTKIADETAAALYSIVESVETAAALVNEIAGASGEQAGAIAQVDKGIEQMSLVVQTNSSSSEETAAAAQELSSQAEMLKSMVSRFRLKDVGNTPISAETVQPEKVNERPAGSQTISLKDEDFGKY